MQNIVKVRVNTMLIALEFERTATYSAGARQLYSLKVANEAATRATNRTKMRLEAVTP